MNKRALSLVLTLGVLAAPLALSGCEEKKPEPAKPAAPATPAAPADKPK